MEEESKSFALASREAGAPAPVLCGVRAESRLDGVLFETTLRQTYRNRSDRVLEVVYTFPLPHRAVLLGFASELGGRRQVGTVVGKRAAEARYEEALADGDAPVMLEALNHGLHTANIGNLQPGDEIVLEVRFAQLLAFEQGRLRLALPTTIAPRFGQAQAAGLQAQQVPQPSLEAEYPLALSLTVGSALAGATVDCPTHACTHTVVEGGLRLDLAAGAALDRDVVFIVQPREPLPSLQVRAPDLFADPPASVVMAALQPRSALAPREAVTLKLLVDCSGSMGGDSIASAQRVVQGVLAGLGEPDTVSLSRFGTHVQHVLAPTAASAPRLKRLLAPVAVLAADLGGTEMAAALRAVFALPAPAGADVLLVTDGQIWQIEQILAEAIVSGHRVFALGVGSAPTAGLLQALADATGGACEFATPGEALEAAAQRMLRRIRQPRWQDLRVDWGGEVLWQTPAPKSIFDGDTVLVFAGLRSGIALPPVRLLATDATGRPVELAYSEAEAPCPGDALPRLAAAQRLRTESPADQAALALRYQLMSPHTHCILVHERSEAELAAEPAALYRVPSMLAAGWGATSTVQPPVPAAAMPAMAPMAMACLSMEDVPVPSVWRTRRASSDQVDYFAGDLPSPSEGDSLLSFSEAARPHSAAPAGAAPNDLPMLVQLVAQHLKQGGALTALPALCSGLRLPAELRAALDRLVGSGLDAGTAWLLLAHWIAGQAEGLAPATVRDELRALVTALPRMQTRRALRAFNEARAAITGEPAASSRLERLGQALRKAIG